MHLLPIAFVAAVVTGALGYGFSSITVPIALLFFPARVLNPALVVIELVLNLYALFLNRHSAKRIAPRLWLVLVGLVPGVIIGSLFVSRIDASALKMATFTLLLPLILIQAAGLRWPIRREKLVAGPIGLSVGVLYAVTTISGPPLALFLNNQGLERNDFKVSLAIIRSAESLLTLIAYLSLGLFTKQSLALTPWLIPAVAVGMPIGHWVIRHVSVETFRRVCMSFDAWLVAFAISRQATGVIAWALPATAILIDLGLLRAFFSHSRKAAMAVHLSSQHGV